mmetsp:Transcript_48495/g.136416  ORF Transcript_48495/g.136416 Transcript_48495/m.136416 type:complete len:223 (-) Transcript_48495:345-1013(-)
MKERDRAGDAVTIRADDHQVQVPHSFHETVVARELFNDARDVCAHDLFVIVRARRRGVATGGAQHDNDLDLHLVRRAPQFLPPLLADGGALVGLVAFADRDGEQVARTGVEDRPRVGADLLVPCLSRLLRGLPTRPTTSEHCHRGAPLRERRRRGDGVRGHKARPLAAIGRGGMELRRGPRHGVGARGAADLRPEAERRRGLSKAEALVSALKLRKGFRWRP